MVFVLVWGMGCSWFVFKFFRVCINNFVFDLVNRLSIVVRLFIKLMGVVVFSSMVLVFMFLFISIVVILVFVFLLAIVYCRGVVL